jgi:hypothetical protein
LAEMAKGAKKDGRTILTRAPEAGITDRQNNPDKIGGGQKNAACETKPKVVGRIKEKVPDSPAGEKSGRENAHALHALVAAKDHAIVNQQQGADYFEKCIDAVGHEYEVYSVCGVVKAGY